MADLKVFAEQLVNLTVKEVSQLAEILKVEYGIEPVAAVVANPSISDNKIEEKKEEQVIFDVILKSVGTNKLTIIKLVKELTGLGLKEAKAIVDSAPTSLKNGIAKGEAETLKKSLEEAGAEIEIR